MLWDECFTDADIRRAMENLPKDLHETYHRCLSRIDNSQSPVAHKVLAWVCVAAKPFKSRQLLEALAIDPLNGSLERDNIPLILDVLRSCSNLVIRDENDQIILAHHSVRQFLLNYRDFTPRFLQSYDNLAWERTISGPERFHQIHELELGRLCISHLSSPEYGRAVAAPSTKSAIDVSQVSGAVLGNFNLGFGKWSWTTSRKSKPLFITPHVKPADSTTYRGLPAFFDFAREQWALLTRSIDQTDPSWSKFRALALEPNLTYHIHPWRSIGVSLDSHFSALLGWSINNDHLPLLELLTESENPKPRADIFNLPLTSYDGLLPLHFAAKHGCYRGFPYLLRVCDYTRLDGRRRTYLHYASEMGHQAIFDYIHDFARQQKNGGLKFNAQDDQGHTALHLAAAHGHNSVTPWLMHHFPDVRLKDNRGRTALSLAAMNGHAYVMHLLLDSLGKRDSGIPNVKDADGKTPLMLAVMNDHLECVTALSDWGVDKTLRDNQHNTALDIAVRKTFNLPRVGSDSLPSSGKALIKALESTRSSAYAVANILITLGAPVHQRNARGSTAFHYAAKNGHESTVALLIKADKSSPFIGPNIIGRTPLHEAAAHGHTSIVSMLCQSEHGYPSSADDFGDTALHLAAQNGHTETVAALIFRSEVEWHAHNKQGATPLHLSAQNGHVKVVEMLLKHCIMPGLPEYNEGRTPLHLAAQNGHDTTVETLLKHNMLDVNSEDYEGVTALHLATKHGHVTTMETLLKCKKIDINVQDNEGLTPLHLAVIGGKLMTVQALLNNVHCDVMAADPSHKTALHMAAEKGHAEVVETLLRHHQVDVSARDNRGATALHLAASEGKTSTVGVMLEKRYCKVNANISNGRTALHMAAFEEHVATVQALLQSPRIYINGTDKRGRTAPHAAATEGISSVDVELLNDIDTVRNAQDDILRTPLHYAVVSGNIETVRHLLQAAAKINVRDSSERAPLHYAVESDHLVDITLLLLENGADVNARGEQNESPLHIAARAGAKKQVRLLLSKADIEVWTHSREGKRIRDLALENGHFEIARLIHGKQSQHHRLNNEPGSQ